ncbi:putative ankyrin repeat domain-containing protein 20A2 isoform X2 [Polypterus senegalus]|uniref:putative ankyrin repeat domain-containing protein 20A2 isoform X2 n=1 Tax=Polypterus senegalus TaxID=55291 RepID=UPI00196402FD|nr:putative ankyrin repeat domain-containing protein 20A2 isoform X2 [Polypterus senegalus]
MKKFLHYLGLKDNELHAAASVGDLDRLEQLLNRKGKKANVNKADKENRTLLHVACAGGHNDVVSFLVENQAELDPIDDEHQTPLIMAVQHMREECVLILLKNGANPWLKDINGDTALHHAALVSELPLARHLLDYNAAVDTPNKTGCTPLMVAVDKNDQEMATFLLECGADVNAKGRTGRTCLMFAARNGSVDMTQLLLSYHADQSAMDWRGWTAKSYAMRYGHKECLELLLKQRSQMEPEAFLMYDSELCTSEERIAAGLWHAAVEGDTCVQEFRQNPPPFRWNEQSALSLGAGPQEAEQKHTDGMGLVPFNGMEFGKMEMAEEFSSSSKFWMDDTEDLQRRGIESPGLVASAQRQDLQCRHFQNGIQEMASSPNQQHNTKDTATVGNLSAASMNARIQQLEDLRDQDEKLPVEAKDHLKAQDLTCMSRTQERRTCQKSKEHNETGEKKHKGRSTYGEPWTGAACLHGLEIQSDIKIMAAGDPGAYQRRSVHERCDKIHWLRERDGERELQQKMEEPASLESCADWMSLVSGKVKEMFNLSPDLSDELSHANFSTSDTEGSKEDIQKGRIEGIEELASQLRSLHTQFHDVTHGDANDENTRKAGHPDVCLKDSTGLHTPLREQNEALEREMKELNKKLMESETHRLTLEQQCQDLRRTLENREVEMKASSCLLQEALFAGSGMKEQLRRLQMEHKKLKASFRKSSKMHERQREKEKSVEAAAEQLQRDVMDTLAKFKEAQALLEESNRQRRHLEVENHEMKMDNKQLKREFHQVVKFLKKSQDDILDLKMSVMKKDGEILASSARLVKMEEENRRLQLRVGKLEEVGKKLSMQKKHLLEQLSNAESMLVSLWSHANLAGLHSRLTSANAPLWQSRTNSSYCLNKNMSSYPDSLSFPMPRCQAQK